MQRIIAPPRHVRLAATAAAHGGAFTRAQAEAVGYSKAEIHHLVRSGQWIALRRGVYVERDYLDACESDSAEAPYRRHRVAAAATALAVGNAVASHESAAAIFRLSAVDVPCTVWLTRPRVPSGRTRLGGVTIHRAALPDQHRGEWLGVPVTTPARMVIDLGRNLPFWKAVTVADETLHARLTSRAELQSVLADCAGWPGAAQAGRAVRFADPKAESALESVGRVVFAEQGLPPPERQVQIVVRAGQVYRVDFFWRRFRTIAEADGLLKYSDASVLRNEKLRQEALSDIGYQVVRFTWKQVHDDPALVAARIRRAFAHAAREEAAGDRRSLTAIG